MDSPAILLLSDAYGRKNAEPGGFVLCALYGRKSKAFQAASGTSNSTIVANLVSTHLYISRSSLQHYLEVHYILYRLYLFTSLVFNTLHIVDIL